MPPQLTTLQKIKRFLAKLSRRLWWFDVIYPVALGVFLFSALSYAVYAGQRQWRLSLQAEKKLLDFSLLQASRSAALEQHQILVVHADAEKVEGNLLAATGRGGSPDAPVAAYAEVIERLAGAGVPILFVRWDLRNHQGDEAGYFVLGRVLATYKATTKVYFVLPSEQGERLPSGIQQSAEWLDDSACGEASELQSSCSYMPDYRQWAVQRVLETFRKASAQHTTPSWVSDQLPNAFPSYIVQLRHMHESSRRTFSWVQQAESAELAGWRVAFLGVGAAPLPVAAGSELVPTVYDRFGSHGALTGTPLHEFLAMMAQMFALGDEVQVPPEPLGTFMTVVFCLVLVGITAAFDVFVGLAVFLACGLLAPLINALLLRYAKIYVPLFDSFYFGLSVLFVAGLVHLSLLSLQRWRLEALRRLHARAADLKGNFISLLTHNLNTPVAKMQGMLNLLTKQAADEAWLPAAVQSEALVTQLEYAIRSVLIAAALEEGVIHLTARHAQALMDELVASSVASLRRLGVRLTELPIMCDEEGQEYLPLLLDARAVNSAISGVAALFHSPGVDVRLSVGMEVGFATDPVTGDEGEVLKVSIMSTSHWISAEAAAILTAETPLHVRTLSEGLFFPSVLAGLAQLTAATFRGHIELQLECENGVVTGGTITLIFKTLPTGTSGGPPASGTQLA